MAKLLEIGFILRLLILAFAQNSDDDELDFLLSDFPTSNTYRSQQDMSFLFPAYDEGSDARAMMQDPYNPNTGPQAALTIEQHGHPGTPAAGRTNWRDEDPEVTGASIQQQYGDVAYIDARTQQIIDNQAERFAEIQKKYEDQAAKDVERAQWKNKDPAAIMAGLQQTNERLSAKAAYVQKRFIDEAIKDATRQQLRNEEKDEEESGVGRIQKNKRPMVKAPHVQLKYDQKAAKDAKRAQRKKKDPATKEAETQANEPRKRGKGSYSGTQDEPQ